MVGAADIYLQITMPGPSSENRFGIVGVFDATNTLIVWVLVNQGDPFSPFSGQVPTLATQLTWDRSLLTPSLAVRRIR